MATMADVAREANVSVATVSRLLTNQGVVSPETAKRVYAAIEKLSYEPNLLARNLRRNESRVILIMSPNVTNPYYSHILSGIGNAATELGYSALICTTLDDANREREALEMLKKHRADGAILMASYVGPQLLQEYSDLFPLVQCSEFYPEADIPHVSIDNYLATQQTISYLIGLGHRRIAMISSENNYISTHLRLMSYKDTLRQQGLEAPDDYVRYASVDYSFKSGKRCARELLNVEPCPTAIVCISDTLALGAITAAKEIDRRVPDDVSVIGFDDVEHTTMFHPYITTIAQPCYDLGIQSVNLLYEQMSGRDNYQRQKVLEHRLIIRESSSAPTMLV